MRAVQSGLSQRFVELSTFRTRNDLLEGDQIRVVATEFGVDDRSVGDRPSTFSALRVSTHTCR